MQEVDAVGGCGELQDWPPPTQPGGARPPTYSQDAQHAPAYQVDVPEGRRQPRQHGMGIQQCKQHHPHEQGGRVTAISDG